MVIRFPGYDPAPEGTGLQASTSIVDRPAGFKANEEKPPEGFLVGAVRQRTANVTGDQEPAFARSDAGGR